MRSRGGAFEKQGASCRHAMAPRRTTPEQLPAPPTRAPPAVSALAGVVSSGPEIGRWSGGRGRGSQQTIARTESWLPHGTEGFSGSFSALQNTTARCVFNNPIRLVWLFPVPLDPPACVCTRGDSMVRGVSETLFCIVGWSQKCREIVRWDVFLEHAHFCDAPSF